MSDTVFVVEHYCDRVRERQRKLVEREQQRNGSASHVRQYRVFDTEINAIDFLVARALEGKEKAVADLAKAEKRLKKCRQWRTTID